jgi:hypothetical protein
VSVDIGQFLLQKVFKYLAAYFLGESNVFILTKNKLVYIHFGQSFLKVFRSPRLVAINSPPGSFQ